MKLRGFVVVVFVFLVEVIIFLFKTNDKIKMNFGWNRHFWQIRDSAFDLAFSLNPYITF